MNIVTSHMGNPSKELMRRAETRRSVHLDGATTDRRSSGLDVFDAELLCTRWYIGIHKAWVSRGDSLLI